MAQPIKKNTQIVKRKNAGTPQQKKKRKHKEYGTSKLEERFAKNFLDKLGVKYVYQFKAESIGRYYDFYLPYEMVLIEVDGDYWHSKNVLYENMTPTQKRNKRVDKLKDHWAKINGLPLIRIWEEDINKHPEKVLKMLQEKLITTQINKRNKEEKNKRHGRKLIHSTD